jgi:hypothetical protein
MRLSRSSPEIGVKGAGGAPLESTHQLGKKI